LNLHILPAIGDSLIRDIEPRHVENLVQAKMKTQLRPRTIRNMLIVLQSIFSLAMDNDVVDRSPVRKKHRPEVSRTDKPTWTPEQVRSNEVPEKFRALFTAAALTGLRIGELLALQWKHVDFENRTLRIVQSLWYGELVEPKTKASNRTVLFGEQLGKVLTHHLEQSGRIGPNDFVFCDSGGTPLIADVLRRDVLYPAIERLRLPRLSRSAGFHAFRHSAASFINAQTGNLKLAQKLLGHSEISTTADIYTHTTDESEREATLALERAIFGDLFPICSLQGTGNKEWSA
jgi:integrase